MRALNRLESLVTVAALILLTSAFILAFQFGSPYQAAVGIADASRDTLTFLRIRAPRDFDFGQQPNASQSNGESHIRRVDKHAGTECSFVEGDWHACRKRLRSGTIESVEVMQRGRTILGKTGMAVKQIFHIEHGIKAIAKPFQFTPGSTLVSIENAIANVIASIVDELLQLHKTPYSALRYTTKSELEEKFAPDKKRARSSRSPWSSHILEIPDVPDRATVSVVMAWVDGAQKLSKLHDIRTFKETLLRRRWQFMPLTRDTDTDTKRDDLFSPEFVLDVTDMFIFDILLWNCDRFTGGNLVYLPHETRPSLLHIDHGNALWRGNCTERLSYTPCDRTCAAQSTDWRVFNLRDMQAFEICRFRRKTISHFKKYVDRRTKQSKFAAAVRAALEHEISELLRTVPSVYRSSVRQFVLQQIEDGQWLSLDGRFEALLEHFTWCSDKFGERSYV